MSEAEIRRAIAEIARRDLGLDASLPRGELSEHLDSVQRLQLAVALEDHFEIVLEPELERELRTLEDLVLAIREKTSTGAS